MGPSSIAASKYSPLRSFLTNHFVLMLITIAAVLIWHQSCHGSQNPYPEDIQAIKDRGKLVVTQFNGERPGFFMYDQESKYPDYTSYDDNGKRLIGYDIEIAKKIADRLGVDLEIQRVEKSFTNLCRVVGKNEADLGISKLTITMDRGQYVRFTDPYVILKIGLLINRLEEVKVGPERKKDLFSLLNHPDAKIAVQKGTSWVPFCKDLFPKAQLVQYPNMNSALEAVEQGETIAFLNDEWNIASKLKIKPELTVRVRLAFVPDIRSGIAMAVSPKSPNLLAFLNLMIERDRLRTTPANLLDKYFAEGSSKEIANAMAMAERKTKPTTTPMIAILIIGSAFVILTICWIVLASRRKFEPVKVANK